MKKLTSIVLVCVLAFTMICGTSVFAAGEFRFDDVKYTEGQNLVVSLYLADTTVTSINLYGCIGIEYDGETFELVSYEGQSGGTIYDWGTAVVWSNEVAAVTPVHSEPILTATFKVKDSVTDSVIGKTFKVGSASDGTTGFSYNGGTTQYEFDDTVSVAVTAAGPTGPTAEKVENTTSAGITGYTVSTLADKKVMVSEKLIDQEITEETRLYVTYKGETRKFGSDLYAKLGGTPGSSIEIGSLTFGLIVDGSAAAADFTFELK